MFFVLEVLPVAFTAVVGTPVDNEVVLGTSRYDVGAPTAAGGEDGSREGEEVSAVDAAGDAVGFEDEILAPRGEEDEAGAEEDAAEDGDVDASRGSAEEEEEEDAGDLVEEREPDGEEAENAAAVEVGSAVDDDVESAVGDENDADLLVGAEVFVSDDGAAVSP